MEKPEHGRPAQHVVETDVVVLGGGAAGCMAAIGAREQGCGVTLVEKGQVDSCGCCGGGQDHFEAHLNSGPDWDTDEAATNYYAVTGWGVGRGLVEKTYTKVVASMVKRMEGMGIEFFRTETGEYWRTQALGQPGPWYLMMKDGLHLKRKIAAAVRAAGANTLEQVMVTKLLVTNGRIVGAMGFNRKNGEIYVLKARAVVIAMGSHQSRWSTNSSGNAFNIWQYPYNTGTQVVAAYEAGAKLVNLEKCTCTTIPKAFGAPGIVAFAGMGGRMINVREEQFMDKYHPLGEAAPRGYHISGERQECLDGRSPLYIDVRQIPEKDMEHLKKNLLNVDKATYLDYLDQRHIDLRKDLLEVEVGEYSGFGNLLVDENLESNIKGLFGLPFSGMLSTAMCGGLVAGTEAGKAALKAKGSAKSDLKDSTIEAEIERVRKPLGRQQGYTPGEFEDLIREVMRSYMGPIRTVKGLQIALHDLNNLEALADRIKANNVHELLRANEAIDLLKYCELMVRAVIERKGVRGFYTVGDYIHSDPELRSKHVVLSQEDGQQKISYEPYDTRRS